MIALYIHVPFCARICHYCDFAVLKAPERIHAEYVDLVARELQLRAPEGLAGVRTAYLGGGTPSVLEPTLLERLLNDLAERGLANLAEFTMEFNPEQVGENIVTTACSGGIDRFSLGIQSLNNELLVRIGRGHSAEQALAAWELLSVAGFRTGSVDLMFNLPGQTTQGFLQDVDTIISRKPQHVSLYGLGVEQNTLFGQQVRRGEWSIDEDLYAEMYNGAIALLGQSGLERYEVSNCALLGHESLHNQAYWKRTDYLGVGPGAHSCLDGVRLAGPRSYSRWREWVRADCPLQGMEKDLPDRSGRMTEALWLALRCREGICLSVFQTEFGVTLPEKLLARYVERGWLNIHDGWARLRGDGWLFMDSIATDLLARLS